MKKQVLMLGMLLLVVPMALSNEGLVSDSCVNDRSCCEKIPNSLDFVCFRNDTNSSFTNPFEPKDLYGNTTDYAYMGYPGSKFALKNDDLNNYAWSGVGRTAYGKTSFSSSTLIAVPSDKDKVRNNVWGLTVNGDTTGGANQRSETYTVPINEWSFFILTKITCRSAGGCNINGNDAVFMFHKSSRPQSVVNATYGTLINNTYHGLRLNFTPTAADSYEQNITTEWLIAFNRSPDGSKNVSATERRWYWNLTQGENITLAVVFTTKEYEGNVSGWFENPIRTIDRAINESMQRMRMLKYPSHLNDSQKKSYYFGLLNYWMNTVRSHPRHVNTSAWGTNRVIVPTMATYPATWIWDSFIACMGLLEACVDNNVTCLEVCEENLDVFVRNSVKDTSWQQNIRDNNDTVSARQPTGGWDLVTLHLYNRSAINKSYLCNSTYSALKDHYVGKNSTNMRNLSSTEWCIDESSGNSGWDGSVRYDGNCQIDQTGWQALAAESLATIAAICGNYTEQVSFSTEFTYLQNGMNAMWSTIEQDYCDINGSNSCMYNDGNITSPSISVASAWAILINATNATHEIQILKNWENTSRLGTFNKIPTIHTQHDRYDPSGDDENWMGAIWSPPTMVAILALAAKNYTSNLTVIKNRSINMVSESDVIGCEAYMATNNTCAPVFAAPAKRSYIWGDSLLYTATWAVDLLDVFNLSTTSVAINNTPTVPVILYPSGGSTYNLTSIDVNVTSNDPDGEPVTLYYYVNGTLNQTSATNVTFNASFGHYNLTVYAGDGNSNSSGKSVYFTLRDTSPDINWTYRFDLINNDTNNGKGVLHFSMSAMLTGEEPNIVEAYLNMYEATNQTRYLAYAEYHLTNLTDRYPDWGIADGDMILGHAGSMFARFVYLVNKTNVATYRSKATTFLKLAELNISPKIDGNYTEWYYNGERVGALVDRGIQVKPINQQYGYAIMQMYLYNATGNATYYNRSLHLSRAINYTFTNSTCNYDDTRQCHRNPYRYNYTQTWENYSGITFGFSPHNEETNYFVQDMEMIYRFWKHGFYGNQTMQRIANLIYNDMYVHEGNLTNVLMADDTSYPAASFSDNNQFHATMRTHSIPYFALWSTNITNISKAIMNKTYEYIEDGDATHTFYKAPYGAIVDPRDNQASTYNVTNATFDMVLKYISTYIYFVEGETQLQDVFPVGVFAAESTTTTSSSGGGGGTPPCRSEGENCEYATCCNGLICSDNICVQEVSEDNLTIQEKIEEFVEGIKDKFREYIEQGKIADNSTLTYNSNFDPIIIGLMVVGTAFLIIRQRRIKQGARQ